MRPILIAFFIFFSCNLIAQNLDTTNAQVYIDFEVKRSDCYEQDGQQNVNYCLSVLVSDLELIMKTKFDCIIRYYDNKIEEYSRNKKDSLIIADLTYQKSSLLLSQENWRKLSDSNSNYWDSGGGTISGQYVAESLIKDIKDRMLFLDNIISEENQGTEGIDCNQK